MLSTRKRLKDGLWRNTTWDRFLESMSTSQACYLFYTSIPINQSIKHIGNRIYAITGNPVIFHRGTVMWDGGLVIYLLLSWTFIEIDAKHFFLWFMHSSFEWRVMIILDFVYRRSFNESNHYQRQEEGPIEEDTIVVLDTKNGQLLASWGGNLFYMPHGITMIKTVAFGMQNRLYTNLQAKQ